jgi:cysteine synthase A
MARIYGSIIELIGRTPLLELNNYGKEFLVKARIIAKLEYFNPGGSVKDRIAYAMIADAEKRGVLKKDSVIIEPTSGNTGIGLAMVAASKGYRLILTMAETMSLERRNLLAALGAELVLTPGAQGMTGAINKAKELAAQLPGSFIPQQFDNPANPDIHYRTTAQEIWEDTGGNIDAFVAGVGTGGTISGVGAALKKKNPNIKIIAFEPFDSAVLSGGTPGPHKLQGIGAGFVPKNFNRSVVDRIIQVKAEDAFRAARDLAHTEGVLTGITSGASLWTATRLAAEKEFENKTIVALLPDTGERYLSTELFSAK